MPQHVAIHETWITNRRPNSPGTVDRVREVCPEFPGEPRLILWSIPDPAREPGSDEETLPAFGRTATELCTRVGFLIAAIEQTTTGQEVTERA